ncbi:hypothetical protein HII36_31920 [Nonomuraea sp. NN258]|uniref:HdeD family acid-resistance protein n=1 Tax=Nonomuraea antri TaxID=2730852 RepID=UPI0015692F33|nr:DUF308 domain-containing protein [Nonomuraea antri]NRQ36409.1 hypothetical protein [Nonomuraea antri]
MLSRPFAPGARPGRPAGVASHRPRGQRVVALKGLATTLMGVLLVAWPKDGFVPVLTVFGVLFLVLGAFDLAKAIAARDASFDVRLMFVLLSGLLVTVGLLALHTMIRTVEALMVVLGLVWLLTGMIELVGAVGVPRRPGDAPALTLALFTTFVGIVTLLSPTPSMTVLSLITGAWLIVWGGLTVLVAAC